MPEIKFVSNRPWLNENSISKPEPVIKTIPEWYINADRHYKHPQTGEHVIGPDGGKIVTWKGCPAIYDIMGSGYVYKTPCDIEFFINHKGETDVKVHDPNYQDFCTKRDPLPQFRHPDGYSEQHFAWWADWAVEVPEGYSVLYTTPLNRYELPFITTNGIIDNDKVNLPGTMPFFLIKGFTGVIPAGTPYAQLIPFKRENWESTVIIEPPEILYEKNMKNAEKYRVPDGGIYQREVWERRTYK
jgi:hypothetical protein